MRAVMMGALALSLCLPAAASSRSADDTVSRAEALRLAQEGAKGEKKPPKAGAKKAPKKTPKTGAKDGGAKDGAKAGAKKGKLAVTWLGHAAFEVVTPAGTKLLIDPFLKGNPSTPADRKELSAYKPDVILVTHSHMDHLGDAVEIAKASGAKLIAAHDLVTSLEIDDGQKLGGNVGGAHVVKDVTVRFVPAMHGSKPGGRPVGFVIEAKGAKTIYHSGDTWIFSDMALIDELYSPQILLFNTGGGPYTQSPAVARLGAKRYFKKAKHIIPMHYGTFPPLAKEAEVKKAFKGDKRLKVLKPGETASF